MEGWIQDTGQSLANYPIYSQCAAAMQKLAFPFNASVFRSNWMFYKSQQCTITLLCDSCPMLCFQQLSMMQT